jgi:SAM-dependent methyltransferase
MLKLPVRRRPPPASKLADVLRDLSGLWERYEASDVDRTVSEHDDMLPNSNMDYYLAVGRNAIEIVTDAMVLTHRTSFSKILDMPCGGGRVTRHLVKFLPDAQLFVSDVEKAKQAAVAEQFGATAVDLAPDFSIPSERHYDLIFVGSLLTHVQEEMFGRVVGWCIEALAKDGILIATTCGRTNALMQMQRSKRTGREVPELVMRKVLAGQHAFWRARAPSERYGGTVYGTGIAPGSWVVRQIEAHADATVLGFKEGGWAGNQDAVIAQKIATA